MIQQRPNQGYMSTYITFSENNLIATLESRNRSNFEKTVSYLRIIARPPLIPECYPDRAWCKTAWLPAHVRLHNHHPHTHNLLLVLDVERAIVLDDREIVHVPLQLRWNDQTTIYNLLRSNYTHNVLEARLGLIEELDEAGELEDVVEARLEQLRLGERPSNQSIERYTVDLIQ